MDIEKELKLRACLDKVFDMCKEMRLKTEFFEMIKVEVGEDEADSPLALGKCHCLAIKERGTDTPRCKVCKIIIYEKTFDMGPGEVIETLFHEFGHSIHFTFIEDRYDHQHDEDTEKYAECFTEIFFFNESIKYSMEEHLKLLNNLAKMGFMNISGLIEDILDLNVMDFFNE